MARIWKEPYSEKTALSLGIHDVEGVPVVGGPRATWIYYVRVCSFTFAFFSLFMLEEYLAYYAQKTLPSSRRAGVWIGEPQTRFDRLPLRLREEPKRRRVVKALTDALTQFRRLEAVPANDEVTIR